MSSDSPRFKHYILTPLEQYNRRLCMSLPKRRSGQTEAPATSHPLAPFMIDFNPDRGSMSTHPAQGCNTQSFPALLAISALPENSISVNHSYREAIRLMRASNTAGTHGHFGLLAYPLQRQPLVLIPCSTLNIPTPPPNQLFYPNGVLHHARIPKPLVQRYSCMGLAAAEREREEAEEAKRATEVLKRRKKEEAAVRKVALTYRPEKRVRVEEEVEEDTLQKEEISKQEAMGQVEGNDEDE
ncbi:uncharacterized protein EI90DRAFT_3019963 [Cantharellus anzutake]|uniref:uncharacterized protein n=1 Tax=Cantharellus anzutake TaxID=1750568 RepID=UPI001906CA6D|nr:uncharacterized protein EI90DRAFT_3019963 [Cantharellus anzutake]KAF8322899.1 hypothetical protein EI90DRAFT_3019963 [Cantharellus anzutake]